MMHGNPLNADNAMDSMFVTMRNEYPQVYACVQQIDTFLHGTYGWQCSKEEQLYLIMHIHRVCVERTADIEHQLYRPFRGFCIAAAAHALGDFSFLLI
ncbi:PRD domain [uncultured Clostridium sp.]|nr:PRD domain [uncultured Clostridium sp.]